MKNFALPIFLTFFGAILLLNTTNTQAQSNRLLPEILEKAELPASASATASQSAEEIAAIEKIKKSDVTQPEQEEEKKEFLRLFKNRPADHPTITNFMAYGVQYAVRSGVPANTIILILLLPFLATIIAGFRHIIGLPSLGLLVPIAFSITLLATGISAGAILLAAILLASGLARFLLKRLRIMQLPKMALSMLVVAIFIFIALTGSAAIGILTVKQLSIFPVLLFILLSDRIVALLLERSASETIQITLVTLILGLLGFFLLSFEPIQNFIILYPETVLALIPIDIIIGRYFGLRVSEYVRFAPLNKHGSN